MDALSAWRSPTEEEENGEEVTEEEVEMAMDEAGAGGQVETTTALRTGTETGGSGTERGTETGTSGGIVKRTGTVGLTGTEITGEEETGCQTQIVAIVTAVEIEIIGTAVVTAETETVAGRQFVVIVKTEEMLAGKKTLLLPISATAKILGATETETGLIETAGIKLGGIHMGNKLFENMGTKNGD